MEGEILREGSPHRRARLTGGRSTDATAVTTLMASLKTHFQSWPAPESPAPAAAAAELVGTHGWTLRLVGSRLAEALRGAKQTIALGECTTGGILAASLLSLPGASSYFTGSTVAYSPTARGALLPGCDDALKELEQDRGCDSYASMERYYESRVVWAIHAARDLQLMCGADWSIAEVGAAGPTFHPSAGTSSGFTVIAVCGPPRGERESSGDGGGSVAGGEGVTGGGGGGTSPPVERVWVRMCETGHAFREENMWQFAAAAAELCARCVEDASFLADNERADTSDGWRAVLARAVESGA